MSENQHGDPPLLKAWDRIVPYRGAVAQSESAAALERMAKAHEPASQRIAEAHAEAAKLQAQLAEPEARSQRVHDLSRVFLGKFQFKNGY